MPDSGAAALTDPRQAVAYLEEISPELRGCAILDRSCKVLASTGEDGDWQEACRKLLEDADSTAGEPVNHLHIATGDGEVFGVRHEGLVAVGLQSSPAVLVEEYGRIIGIITRHDVLDLKLNNVAQ
jgi:hypothetical protein